MGGIVSICRKRLTLEGTVTTEVRDMINIAMGQGVPGKPRLRM
jgi:hypothetical protein